MKRSAENKAEQTDVVVINLDDSPPPAKKCDLAESSKLENGRVYLTEVNILPDRFNSKAFSLAEILRQCHPIASLHFNFMIDVDWLMQQYPPGSRQGPITFVVGEKMGSHASALKKDCSNYPNISVAAAKLPIPFGTHHTKLSILESEEKVHVIISTANLVSGDWEAKTQCFYYAVGSFSDTSSPSSQACLIRDLIDYIKSYNLDVTEYWTDRLAAANFGDLSDQLVYSRPGYHVGETMNKVGHLKLRSLLKPSQPIAGKSRLFVCQCSSIGSLGKEIFSWLTPQFLKSMKGGRENSDGRVLLIYPTVEDVRGSIEGYAAGGSLPYQKSTASRQTWLNSILCKWRSEKHARSKAMPHCKTYTELVDGQPQWMLVTSANMSKAAWGEMQKNCSQLMIRSYEMGVLITDKSKIDLPYDYPLCKYSPSDKPWICDDNYEVPDSHGETYVSTPPMGVLDWLPRKRTRLATVGDINVYNEDVTSLMPGCWLNDNIITFMLEYQLSQLDEAQRSKIHIVHAPMCEALKQANDPLVVQMFFEGVTLSDKDIVLFVVNNNEDAGRSYGGSHWVLLAYFRIYDLFVCFDSLSSSSGVYWSQRIMASVLSTGLIPSRHAEFVSAKCAKQANSSDCGMFVVEFSRIVMQNGYGETSFMVDPHSMTERRLNWIATIRSLYDASSNPA